MARVLTLARSMTADDLDAVLAIEEATFPTPWSRAMLEGELAATGRSYLVVEGPDGLIAYGGVMVAGAEGHVMTLATVPAHRGRGHARRLLVRLLRDAIALGAERLLLEVRPSNRAARRLYSRFGFAPVGIRPRYYRDEDALVMWVDDAATDDYARLLEELDR